MKTLHLTIIAIITGFAVIVIALSLQIVTMQENTRMLHETNDKLRSILNNYTTIF